jgi:Zn-dependent peptidase ImmA (M78 family)
MGSQRTIIKPEMIRWARSRTGLTVQDFAKKMRVSESRIIEWESGITPITMGKAQQLANLSLIPLGSLFLSKVPNRDIHLPDFRTINNSPIRKPSLELEATVLEMQEKQTWLREYLIDNDTPELTWIKSISTQTPVSLAVRKIQNTLSISTDEINSCLTWDDYFALLVRKIEDAGVTVIRNGVVGNNSHRPLDIDEFRGFVLVDTVAPLIFINGKDNKNPQMFTLIHELVHLFMGESGLIGPTNNMSNTIERYCNKVAAEFLVPEIKLRSSWNNLLLEQYDTRSIIKKLSKEFKVSSCVIILKCQDACLISSSLASELLEEEEYNFKVQKKNKVSGGDFYANLKFRVGQSFARIVISELYNQNITYGDAFRLLRVKDMQGVKMLSEKVGLPIL